MAHVSSFVSVVVGRNRSAHEGTAGAHAARTRRDRFSKFVSVNGGLWEFAARPLNHATN
jgi:hypothetical protein